MTCGHLSNDEKTMNDEMKRYFSCVVLCVLMAVLGGSCGKVDDSEHFKGSYNAGKQSFEYLENNMAAFMSFFDLAIRMNAYLEKPADEQEEVRNDYFQDYQIYEQEAGQWLGIKAGDTIFRVISDGLDIMTESSVWKFEGCCEAYKGAMTVICTGYRCWSLELASVVNGNWVSEAHLKVGCQSEHLPADFNGGDWIVSGAGKSVSEDCDENGGKMILDFEVAESLIKISHSKYLFDKGILFMGITDFERQREEVAKAEWRSTSGQGRLLKITYNNAVYQYNDESDLGISPAD